MLNIPNFLTIFRIFLIPVLVVLYYWDLQRQEVLITSVFVIAAITDWLDGFLARKMGATSKLGAFLDPVADKLIVSSALVLLVSDSSILDQVIHPAVFAVAVSSERRS
jgi:CDP-diacylglycerol--glycerol-3-phosphate 3-phosphatidyltransferase